MLRSKVWVLLLAVASFGTVGNVYAEVLDKKLEHSVLELRSSIGTWEVVTEFLKPDGEVAKSVVGEYQFQWVVPDRVAMGTSKIPELKQASAVLFYINEAKKIIEMSSVGPDGQLWVMTGDLGGNTRYTTEYPTADGGTGQLRFTRFNVEENRFESRMEYTSDGGKSWLPGNHQIFKRAA